MQKQENIKKKFYYTIEMEACKFSNLEFGIVVTFKIKYSHKHFLSN